MEERDLVSDILDLVNSDMVFTDLIIEEAAPIVAKTPGGYITLDLPSPTRDDIAQVMDRLDADWAESIRKQAINRPFDLTNWRLRINAYLAYGGKKVMMSIRKIPMAPVALRDTGLPESVRLMLDARKGIILVNGSTGSGKSTSLAALVDAINDSRAGHIITIEDPIEYLFARKQSVFSQREIGVDVDSFFHGVRDAMRQTPDVIVIGEIRDHDTAETALLAAESGVLVIGTLHANDAAGAVQKLMAYFSPQDRDSKLLTLSNTLIGVISQMLLPNIDRDGWALASELLFNHKQQFSKILRDPEQLSNLLARADDSMSRTMSESVFNLVREKKVLRADAVRALAGSEQAALIEKLKAASL